MGKWPICAHKQRGEEAAEKTDSAFTDWLQLVQKYRNVHFLHCLAALLRIRCLESTA